MALGNTSAISRALNPKSIVSTDQILNGDGEEFDSYNERAAYIYNLYASIYSNPIPQETTVNEFMADAGGQPTFPQPPMSLLHWLLPSWEKK